MFNPGHGFLTSQTHVGSHEESPAARSLIKIFALEWPKVSLELIFKICSGVNTIVVLKSTSDPLPPLIGFSLQMVRWQSYLLHFWCALKFKKLVYMAKPFCWIISCEARKLKIRCLGRDNLSSSIETIAVMVDVWCFLVCR